MILLLDAGYHAVTFVSQVLSGHMCHYSMLCYVMYTRSDYFIMDNSMLIIDNSVTGCWILCSYICVPSVG